jgi:hypothetical protein
MLYYGVDLRLLTCLDSGFESRRRHECCLFSVSVVSCQVEVFALERSLVQRSPTECDRDASTMQRPWPNMGLLRK